MEMPEINMTKPVKVQAKTLSIHMKVCDAFEARLLDQDGATLVDYEGYVPRFMPGEHYGDYLILEIEIDTGKIVNWKTPTARDLEQWIKEQTEDR
jgi:hypothetical protein